MAYDLSVSAITSDNNKFYLEPRWWNINELRNTYQFEVVGSHGYTDYVLYVKKQTFIQILNSQEKYRLKGLYSTDGWKQIIDEEMKKLDDFIEKLTDTQEVEILIFEWESGLG